MTENVKTVTSPDIMTTLLQIIHKISPIYGEQNALTHILYFMNVTQHAITILQLSLFLFLHLEILRIKLRFKISYIEAFVFFKLIYSRIK